MCQMKEERNAKESVARLTHTVNASEDRYSRRQTDRLMML